MTMTDDEPRRPGARDEYWRRQANRHAAHVALNASRKTGVPVSAHVQKILDDEAREIAESA